jgi:hypothetical protein
MALRLVLSVLIILFSLNFCFSDYVDDILSGKRAFDSVVSELYSTGKYQELYDIVDKLSKLTNSERILIEKIKLSYSLGKEGLADDIYRFLDIPSPNVSQLILTIGKDEKLISEIGKYIITKGVSRNVLINYSRMCLLNNSLSSLVLFLTNVKLSNEFSEVYSDIVDSLLQKLDYYRMNEEILAIYYAYRNYLSFSEFQKEVIANALVSMDKPIEALKLVSSVDSMNAKVIRIKSLAMLGDIDSALEEAKNLRIVGVNARVVFVLFLNKSDLKSAKNIVIYLDEPFRQFSQAVVSIFEDNLLKAEEIMKNILTKSYFDAKVKNLCAVLLWVINNSSDVDEAKVLSLSMINRFTKVKNESIFLNSQEADKLKKVEGYLIP